MQRLKIILLLLLTTSISAFSQNKIQLIHANVLQTIEDYGLDYQFLSGQVILAHDSSTIFCDSAVYNTKKNNFKAYHNIRLVTIKDKDTVLMFCDSLFYLGDSSFAFAYGNIKLEKDSVTLYSDTLIYDIKKDEAKYTGWGKIVSKKDTLISGLGIYNTHQRKAYFKYNVKVLSPDYKIYSDTLVHDFQTDISYFLGPTKIVTDSSTTYCNKGIFNHDNNTATITSGSKIIFKNQQITAQTINFDQNTELATAQKDVEIIDTSEKYILKGQYGEFHQHTEKAFLTGKPTLIQYDNNDSIWLHGDTLYSFKDTTIDEQDTFIYRKAIVFHHVKTYNKHLQAKCDSLVYSFLDSTMYLYGMPIIWSDSIQIYGNSAELTTVNGDPYQLIFDGDVYLAQHTLDNNFNQITGKKVVINFKNRQISHVDVLGKAQAIYFIYQDSTLIAINNLQCDTIQIFMKDKKIRGLKAIGSPQGKILPPDQATEKNKKFPEFQWYQQFRPLKPDDIYIWVRK